MLSSYPSIFSCLILLSPPNVLFLSAFFPRSIWRGHFFIIFGSCWDVFGKIWGTVIAPSVPRGPCPYQRSNLPDH